MYPDCPYYSHKRYSPPFLATISSNRADLHSLQCSTVIAHFTLHLIIMLDIICYNIMLCIYQWRQEMEMVLKAHWNYISPNNVVELLKIQVTFTCFIGFENVPTIAGNFNYIVVKNACDNNYHFSHHLRVINICIWRHRWMIINITPSRARNTEQRIKWDQITGHCSAPGSRTHEATEAFLHLDSK